MFEAGAISNNGSPDKGDEGSYFLFKDKMYNKYRTKLTFIFEDIEKCGLCKEDVSELKKDLKQLAKEQ